MYRKPSEKPMKNVSILFFIALDYILLGYQNSHAMDRYKTYEVVEVFENGLTLKDNFENLIDLEKDPEGYKVGYKVRYESTRNRLRNYRWQD